VEASPWSQEDLGNRLHDDVAKDQTSLAEYFKDEQGDLR
jgi:hypothetical protein